MVLNESKSNLITNNAVRGSKASDFKVDKSDLNIFNNNCAEEPCGKGLLKENTLPSNSNNGKYSNMLYSEKPLLTIAHFSDPHVSSSKEEHLKNFLIAISYINTLNPDMVVITGDLCDSPSKENFLLFKEYLNRIIPPTYYVSGNHDIGNKSSLNELGAVTKNMLLAYKNDLREDYWYHKKNFIHLIGINSIILNSKFSEENIQYDWLKNTLGSIPSDQKILVFSHYPLFMNSRNEKSDSVRYWTIDPPAKNEILDLLSKFKITAYCCGHCHIPMIKQYDNIKFVFAPAISFSLSDKKEETGINIIKIFADNMSIETLYIKDIAEQNKK